MTGTSKSKTPATAAATKSATGKRTASDASADAVPVPAKAVSKTQSAGKTGTTRPTIRTAAIAAKHPVAKPAGPSNEERRRWIATAAYHRAEKRGFAPGYEVQDWLDAEAEINELIGQARSR